MRRKLGWGGALALAALLGAGAPDARAAADTDSIGFATPAVGSVPPDSTGADADTTGALADTVQATAGADTTHRVPGTPFRFGGTVEMAQRHGDFPIARVMGRRGEVARAGPGRWFGVDGTLTLFFLRGRLKRVEFEAAEPSPREIDYAQDELRRAGFRRRCETVTPQGSSCMWLGRARVQVQVTATTLAASIEAPLAPRPPAVPLPPPMVMVEEVFVIGRETVASTLPQPKVASSPPPVYPESAAGERVQGNVWIRALVDTDGDVLSASVTRGIPELDAAAVRNAMQWRFEPYRLDGVPARFEIEFPVRFILR